MEKLIIQKKPKSRYNNNKKFSMLSKSSGLISLASNPGISARYSGPCGEGCCFLVGQPGGETAGENFFCFP
jgi:hypothetical protein